MKTALVNVSELKAGPALDWAVAKANGLEVDLTMEFASKTNGSQSSGLVPWVAGALRPYKPSTDWAQGGPLIDTHIGAISGSNGARSYCIACIKGETASSRGDSILEAACIAIVRAKFGDSVTVPDALMEVQP